MHFLDKIIENFKLSFVWKSRDKKTVTQKGADTQLYQEKGAVATVNQFEGLTINNIQILAHSDNTQLSQDLMNVVAHRFLAEQAVKQRNFSETVNKANLSLIESPHEPEKDWLQKWVDVSQTISKEEVQNMLARILSGEVKNPNTFSLRTLDVIKNLSKNELEIFQVFCDISFNFSLSNADMLCVIHEPFSGSPGSNSLSSIGLSYSNLTVLQDAGLIQTDLTAWRELPIQIFYSVPFSIGSRHYVPKILPENPPTNDTDAKLRMSVINFTAVGKEIHKVLNLGFNTEYDEKFVPWFKDKVKVDLV